MLKSMPFAAATLLVLSGCADVLPSYATAPLSNPAPEPELLSDVAVSDDAATLAALAANDAAPAAPVASLFGNFISSLTAPSAPAVSAPRTGPDALEISFGEQIPYGQIATVCDVPRGRMGTKVDEAGGFSIYDTIPNTTAQRPHFITGFPDGCARQITAALVLLGDVGTHELVRYNTTNRVSAYSDADNAYEAIKASFCRAGFSEPCGAKIDRLSNITTFLTVYERFGGTNEDWFEALLYNGAVTSFGNES